MKIGFFDSGMGGLSVMHRAFQKLPSAQFIYYADESHVPYGEKTIEQIIEYTDEAVGFMVSQGAKSICIACNTATSAAITYLRNKYKIPMVMSGFEHGDISSSILQLCRLIEENDYKCENLYKRAVKY